MPRIVDFAPARAFAGVLAALLLPSCSGTKSPAAAPLAEVGMVTLVAQPVTITAELTGRTTATMVSEVRPQVDGIIQARLFTEGALVRAGQPLYQIDARLYRAARDSTAAQLGNAQAAVVTAEAKAARYAQLRDLDAVSRQDIDDATALARQDRANVRQYRANLRNADVTLGFTRVYAPISGRIGRSAYTQGALVTAAQITALATIQRLDPIYVDIQQSSTALLDLRESLRSGDAAPASATVQLVLDNGRPYPQAGTIEFGEAVVDPATGTVTLRARFPNAQGLLLPGMFVRIIVPQSVVRDGILAPQQGITRDPRGNATALVIGPGDTVITRPVTAAKAIGANWLVTAGLKAGDRLIVQGVGNAQPGAKVKPIALTLPSTPSTGAR
jgi:membrane fusion protein (multidrug efflux system)